MNITSPQLAIGFTTLFILMVCPMTGSAQDAATREKAAREAAVTYAKAYNLKTGRTEALTKIISLPFFTGSFTNGGSGSRLPIEPIVLKEEKDLHKWLGPHLGFPRSEHKLPLEVRHLGKYADFRSKYLETVLESETLGDTRMQLQLSVREALDSTVGKDGLIVYLGGESGPPEGVLLRFEKGTAKVVGMLGSSNPDLGWFSVVRPITEKGK